MDAWREKYGAPARAHGIHCRLEPEDAMGFRRWLKVSCPTAQIKKETTKYRMNGKRWQSSTYYIVVTDPKEQMLFTLKYL
jgi:hypothetical protein